MSGANGPTLAGFQDFVTNVMQIDPLYLPVGAPVITMAYNVAISIVNTDLATIGACGIPYTGPSIYALAVYNLAASNVINYAQDQPGRTYFTDLRAKLNLNSWQAGVVSSTGDNGTSTSLANPEFMRNFTLQNLRTLKDPYGRQYMEFAQAYGETIVGLS